MAPPHPLMKIRTSDEAYGILGWSLPADVSEKLATLPDNERYELFASIERALTGITACICISVRAGCEKSPAFTDVLAQCAKGHLVATPLPRVG